MAVSKMTKIVLLLQKEKVPFVLKKVQALQSFEPFNDGDTDSIANNYGNTHTISELEQLHLDIINAQTVLRMYTSDKKLTGKRFVITANEFDKLVEELKGRQTFEKTKYAVKELDRLEAQIQQLDDKMALLKQWENLPFLPEQVNTFKAVEVIVGTLPQFKTNEQYNVLNGSNLFYIETLFQDDTQRGVVVYCEKEDANRVNDILEDAQFSKVIYPFEQLPKEELQVTQQARQKLLDEKKAQRQILKQQAQNYPDLLLLEEEVFNTIQREKAHQLMTQSNHVTGMSGWIEESELPYITETLAHELEEGTYAIVQSGESIEEKYIPTRLTNNKLVEPFELLTEMYGLPKYSEVDPTPLLAPFYAVFFGMMVADVGYGLLMWLGTLFALKTQPLNRGMQKNMRLFHILSYTTMVWGFIFGSFFSFELPFRLLSTTTDAISILALSVVFGIFQLIFGLLVNTHIKIKEKDYNGAISDGLGWVGLIVGALLFVASSALMMPELATLAQWVLIINALGIILFTAFGSKRFLPGLGSGLYKLYGASSYIGDLASYTRLMALCASGASIGAAFNTIVGLLPLGARLTVGIVLFVVLHAINFGLALLGAYVHGIRLQFVEFFGKFYEGGGRRFEPLKHYEKHVNIEKNKKINK